MAPLLQLRWNNFNSSLNKKLIDLREKSMYCDCTIVCEDKLYPAHKFILSTCSEYFEKVFEKTVATGNYPYIILNDISSTCLEALLNYMYCGTVSISQVSLSGLIIAAESLKIKGLAVSDNCEESRIESLPASLSERSLLSKNKRESNKKEIIAEPLLSEFQNKNEDDYIAKYSKLSNDESFSASYSTLGRDVPANYQDEYSEVKEESQELISSQDVQLLEDPLKVDNSSLETTEVHSQEDITYSSSHLLHPTGISSILENPQEIDIKEELIGNYFPVDKIHNSNDIAFSDKAQQKRKPNSVLKPKRKFPRKWSKTYPTGHRLYKCPSCHSSFTTKSNLQFHVKTVHEKRTFFACPKCSSVFSQKGNLKAHFNRIHLQIKPFECSICNALFSLKSTYKYHMKNVHNSNILNK